MTEIQTINGKSQFIDDGEFSTFQTFPETYFFVSAVMNHCSMIWSEEEFWLNSPHSPQSGETVNSIQKDPKFFQSKAICKRKR